MQLNQAEIIQHLQSPHEKDDVNVDRLAEAIFRKMNNQKVSQSL